MTKPELKLDWCSHEAAKYAVEKWHYSGTMPTPPILRIGVWESEKFVGVILFSRGANKNLGTPYGLQCTEVCELTRVALAVHETPVSRMMAIALRMVMQKEKGLRLCVSFADTNEGHHGGIYQAGGWVYSGESISTPKFRTASGKVLHQRQTSKTGIKPQYGKPRRVPKQSECVLIPQKNKHRYLMPLDAEMRAQIEPLRKPYPKRVRGVDGDTSANHAEEGGSIPTRTL